MRIEITADSAVADGQGNRYRHGQTVDVDDALAQSWIEAGHAVEAGGTATAAAETEVVEDQGDRPEPPAAETATRQPPRTTTARARRSKSSE